MRKHSKKRSLHTEGIIQDLLVDLPIKMIAYKWDTAYQTVIDIKNKFTGVLRFRKDYPNPDQYELDL